MGKVVPKDDWKAGAMADEGLQILTIAQATVDPGKRGTGYHVAKAICEQVGGSQGRAFCSFSLKEDFAIDNLAGLCTKAGINLPNTLMEHEGWRKDINKTKQFLQKLVGKTIGGEVNWRTTETGGTVANVDKVYTVAEAEEMMKKEGKEVPTETETPETGGEDW